MSVTASAIRNNRVTYLALVVLLLAGVGALNSLPRAEDPGFTIRTAVVTTYLPGASPSRVEQLVTNTIEEKVQEIPQLDSVTSTSRTGMSLVMVNIKERYTEMRPIWDDLRRKMTAVTSDLPSEAIGPTVNDEFGDVYPVMLTLAGDDFSLAELKAMADEVRAELLRLGQVAKVDVFGDQAERVFVEYNTSRLAEVGLSPGQLRNVLQAQNIISSGGTLVAFGENIALEPSGNFESLEDLRATLVPIPGTGDVLPLGDLTTIRRGYVDPPRAWMHWNGKRCIGLAIAAPAGTGNVSLLGQQVRGLLTELRYDYPVGVQLDTVIFQPAFIDDQVDSFIVNLVQAMSIVLLVMLVSLGLRTGLVVATLIPMAMLTTLWLMQVFGIGLDQISIAALIIALGMLVDNAIVMSESIMVQMSEGKKPFAAAVDSAQELRIPLLTSSLTTSAAFLPIFLAESSLGEYTGSLFKVVTLTLLSSWALSLTMMPLLCMTFIRVKQRSADTSFDSGFYRAYRGGLLSMVRRPWVSLAVIGLLFASALYGLGYVPNVFMPKSDSARLLGELDYPLGTSIEVTEAMVHEVESILEERFLARDGGDGITSWSAYVGSQGGPRYRLSYNPAQDGSEHASFIVNVTDRAFLDEALPALREEIAARFPDLEQNWLAEALGPAGENPVEVRVSGPEIGPLFGCVEDVSAMLRAHAGTYGVRDDWGVRTKKLRVEINQARARRAGVTSEDIAISLQSAMTGVQVTEYREGDEIIPVTLRSVAADRRDVGKLENLSVFAQSTGRSVPLSQVADVRIAWEPSKILRRDLFKTVTVSAQLRPGFGALDAAREVEAKMEELTADWPRGYGWELGGDFEGSSEANASIAAKLPIAGFAILLLLITQFNSFRKTAIILLTIPLGLIGVTVGLLVARQDFTFFALLGLISLSGIIINNAIVLLDRIALEIRDNGRSPAEAVLESAQRRLRPIVVTTATTAGGLLPLWFFGGPMWEPMAVTILFGLLFATALTLGVVPVLYTLLFRVKYHVS